MCVHRPRNISWISAASTRSFPLRICLPPQLDVEHKLQDNKSTNLPPKHCKTHALNTSSKIYTTYQLYHHQLGFLAKRAFPFLRQLTPTVTLHEVVVVEKGSSIKGLLWGFVFCWHNPKKTAENEWMILKCINILQNSQKQLTLPRKKTKSWRVLVHFILKIATWTCRQSRPRTGHLPCDGYAKNSEILMSKDPGSMRLNLGAQMLQETALLQQKVEDCGKKLPS